jgi:hypothetical protein
VADAGGHAAENGRGFAGQDEADEQGVLGEDDQGHGEVDPDSGQVRELVERVHPDATADLATTSGRRRVLAIAEARRASGRRASTSTIVAVMAPTASPAATSPG